MLRLFQKSIIETDLPPVSCQRKKEFKLTGILTNTLVPGYPAVYLYHGKIIRTSVVQSILEADPDHVKFETKNSIYDIGFEEMSAEAAI